MEWQWSAWGDFLQGLGSIGQAAAIGFGAYYAAQSFKGWRQQNVEGRRIEQAERILTATYDVRYALSIIRDPGISINESRTALQIISDSSDRFDKEDWLASAIVLDRLEKNQAAFDRLKECRPMARALFGETLDHGINYLYHTADSIQAAATVMPFHVERPDLKMQAIEIISSRVDAGGTNKTTDEIAEAIKSIEGICLHILRHDEAKTKIK